MTCLDPKYRNVVHCQNIVYVLSENEFEQPKLRVLERFTDRNDYDTNVTQSDIIEELIQVETYEIVLNESAGQTEELNEIIENNQNENVNQTEVEIEPGPHSLRKIECTHCKNYIYLYI